MLLSLLEIGLEWEMHLGTWESGTAVEPCMYAGRGSTWAGACIYAQCREDAVMI
jgi:hypothetical protein